jgi:drug/metabolite transporter (DMT)-like permease
MSRRSWILFGVLAATWGASYMFIKVALEDGVPPSGVVFARLALAALVLVPLAAHMGALSGLRERLGQIAVLALLQVVAPFMLITIGQQEISSSLAGILVASAPIFTYLLAFAIAGEERASLLSLVGVGIGIAGVAMLLGIDAGGSTSALLGGGLVVLATLGYALGAWYLKRRVSGVQPVGVVAGTMTLSALFTAPLVAFDPPSELPALDATASLIALGVLGTGLAFLIYYSLIASEGPARTSLVAYVAPVFALIYGVLLLDESFTAATAAGMALVLGGSWMAVEGRLPWQPRRAPASAPGDGELAAGGIDVAPAGQANGGADPASLEDGLEGGDRLAAGAGKA